MLRKNAIVIFSWAAVFRTSVTDASMITFRLTPTPLDTAIANVSDSFPRPEPVPLVFRGFPCANPTQRLTAASFTRAELAQKIAAYLGEEE